MKKLLILSAFLILILACTFTSCDSDKNSDTDALVTESESETSVSQTEKETYGFHLHSYGEWVTVKEATCTQKGSMERVCACGEKKTKTIEALSHVEVVNSAVSATCLTNGKTEGKSCSVCNTILVPQELVPAGHSYGEWTIELEADCTTEGIRSRICSVCGDENEEVIPFSHNYVECVCSCGDIKYAYNLSFTEVADGYSVSGIGECEDYYIYIPAEYNGKPVTEIGTSAFSGSNIIIEKMFVPASVKRIEKNAFLHNTRFGKIFFAENSQLESIGESAFNASDIYIIKLPEGLKTIGEGAFVSCDNLTEIHIPASLESIGKNAFRYFNENCKVYVSDIGSWCEINFTNDYSNPMRRTQKIYDANGNEIVDVVIPEGITKISNFAFYNAKTIKSITFPTTLKTIGEKVFYDCVLLSSVNIKDLSAWCNVSSKSTIAQNRAAFYLNGEAIVDLVIPQDVTSIGNLSFAGCSSLKTITMHDGVKKLGDGAFMSCVNVTDITLSNGLREIAKEAFQGNTSLKSISIPANVTSIGESAFKNCTALTAIDLPIDLESIGKYAFSGCSAFTEFTIPESVTFIDAYAFEKCTSLTNVYFEDANNWNSGGSSISFNSSSLAAKYLVSNGYRPYEKK